jgi:PAS domain S-box-containing protein
MDTILVVEDDPQSAELLSELLETEVCHVMVARSGAEGRRVLRETSVCLVLLDLGLPDMNGIDLLQDAQRLEVPPDVVIITAYATVESAIKAIEAGAAGYLLKPFDAAQLRTLVDRVIERRRLQRENATLYQQVEEKRRRLEVLYDVSRRLISVRDADEILSLIVKETSRLLGVEGVALRLLEGEEFVLKAHTESAAALTTRSRVKGGSSVSGLVAAAGGPVAIEDLHEDTRYDQAHTRGVVERGFRAFLGVPLRVHGALIGVLNVYATSRRRFMPDEISLLSALADQASVAIESARIFRQEQERRRQVEAVRAIGAEITQELALSTLLELIVRRAMELTGTVSGTIYLWDEAAKVLVPRVWEGLGEWMKDVRFRLGEGVPGTVAERREGIIVNEYRTSPYARPIFLECTQIMALAAEPLLYRDRLVGVINLNREEPGRPFGEEDRQILTLFGAQAAIAIENARLLEKVEAQRAHLAQLFDSALDAIVIADVRGNIVSWNKAAQHIFDYRPEEVVGKSLALLIPERYREAHESSLRRMGSTGEPHLIRKTMEAHALQKGGREIPVELSLVTLKTVEGTYYSSFIRDITARKQAEQMKADFVSFATHQLRTPLAGIKWMLELAAQDPEMVAETRSYIQDAQASNERLIGLVNDLLAASRLERGKLTVAPEEVRLEELTRSVLHDLAPVIAEKRHRVAVEAAGGVSPAWADPQLLRQVVLNLLSNAVKYTPLGGEIAIRTQQEGTAVCWVIQDNGIGIPKEAQRHLFEKFYRAENVQKMETEGTGLGLYLVRLIVEQCGGSVCCESEEGKGSTFFLTLPTRGEGGQ